MSLLEFRQLPLLDALNSVLRTLNSGLDLKSCLNEKQIN